MAEGIAELRAWLKKSIEQAQALLNHGRKHGERLGDYFGRLFEELAGAAMMRSAGSPFRCGPPGTIVPGQTGFRANSPNSRSSASADSSSNAIPRIAGPCRRSLPSSGADRW